MVGASFLLDTSAVSEAIRPAPRPALLARIELHRGALAIAATTWQELVYGAEQLPPGRRRSEIERYLYETVQQNMPVLPYDEQAAAWHGRERARLRHLGTPAPFEDGQVAAVAVRYGLVVVTNNVFHFERFSDIRIENWVG